jgi:hypothetical protein
MGLIDQLGYKVRPANALQRAMWHVTSSRPGAWLFAKTLHHLDKLILRLTHGRVTIPELFAGIPVITLITTGARTGRRREMPLLGVPAGNDIAVIGTHYGQSGLSRQVSRSPSARSRRGRAGGDLGARSGDLLGLRVVRPPYL